MFGVTAGADAHPWQMDIGAAQWTALVLGGALAMWSTPMRLAAERAWSGLGRSRVAEGALVVLAYIACCATMAVGTYNPFIYFHF
jgi:hypothetical protein